MGNQPWVPLSCPSHQSSLFCSTLMTSSWEKLSSVVMTSLEVRLSWVSEEADQEERALARRGAGDWNRRRSRRRRSRRRRERRRERRRRRREMMS